MSQDFEPSLIIKDGKNRFAITNTSGESEEYAIMIEDSGIGELAENVRNGCRYVFGLQPDREFDIFDGDQIELDVGEGSQGLEIFIYIAEISDATKAGVLKLVENDKKTEE